MPRRKLLCCDEFISRLEKVTILRLVMQETALWRRKAENCYCKGNFKDAPIVILDEATAFTDPQNEDKIKNLLWLCQRKNLAGDRTPPIYDSKCRSNCRSEKRTDCGLRKAKGTAGTLFLYMDMWQAHIGAKNWSVSEKKRRCLVMFKSMKRIIRWAGKYRGRLYLGSVFSFSVVYLQPSRQWLLLMRWINLFRHIGRIPQLTLL